MDLETTSQEPVRADLVGISLCAEDGKACYIPLIHKTGASDDLFGSDDIAYSIFANLILAY